MADNPAPEIDQAQVKRVRAGNAIWPGLLLFTGVSFFIYLLVKLFSGTIAPGVGTYSQIVFSALLLAIGGWQMRRARYFYVAVELPEGERKIKGLTKAEQQALIERYAPDGAG